MLKRKSLIVGLVVMSVFTVGLVGCGDSKADDSNNTKVEDNKKTLTEGEFLEKGKSVNAKLNEIITKYGGSSEYNTNVFKSQEDNSKGYYLLTEQDAKINDGSNGIYKVVYNATSLNDSGKEAFNVSIALSPEGNIDINNYKALKEMLTVVVGDNNVDFSKINEISNRILESKRNKKQDNEDNNKDLIKNYDSTISVTLDEKQKELSIDIVDKNIKLDK